MASIKDYITELEKQVSELMAHPYKTTEPSRDDEDEVRYFRRPICEWEKLDEFRDYTGWNAEETAAKIYKRKDIKRIFRMTDLNLFLYPDSGGWLYLGVLL